MGDPTDGRAKSRFAPGYLDALFGARSYDNLVQIVGLICGARRFDATRVDYGLGSPLFVLVEGLQWFAQSIRSGSWTYFEATPSDRQALMLRALLAGAPAEFAVRYEHGMCHWRTPAALNVLDAWMDRVEEANNRWLWAVACGRRDEIVRVLEEAPEPRST